MDHMKTFRLSNQCLMVCILTHIVSALITTHSIVSNLSMPEAN
eukprot:UN08480